MKLVVQSDYGRREISAAPGDTVLEALRQAGVVVNAPCGGHGTCGKCTVYHKLGTMWMPVSACKTPVREGMELCVPEQELAQVEGTAEGKVGIQPDPGLSGYGIACDIGTTTVVCRLVELASGRILRSAGAENAQRPYGHDVISRIRSAMSGRLPELTAVIRQQLTQMIKDLCDPSEISVKQITRMVVAANPTMCHLLSGLPPDSLGRAPFAPVSLFGSSLAAHTLELPFEGEVYIAPSISGFVGGDITAGMLASDMDRADGVTVLMDIGTNGEIVLGQKGRFACCSTAAGPVFEGAHLRCGMTAGAGAITEVEWSGGELRLRTVGEKAAAGICGSGFLDAAAMLLDLGIVDETGRMLAPSEAGRVPSGLSERLVLLDGAPAFQLTGSVFVTQADIRQLQLGKAAIAAGLQVLLDTYGISLGDVDRLLLAGGFGSRLRPASAARLGLIPAQLLPVTRAAGNASVSGAGIALISVEAQTRLRDFQKSAEYIELSVMPSFSTAYMEAMVFPEVDE